MNLICRRSLNTFVCFYCCKSMLGCIAMRMQCNTVESTSSFKRLVALLRHVVSWIRERERESVLFYLLLFQKFRQFLCCVAKVEVAVIVSVFSIAIAVAVNAAAGHGHGNYAFYFKSYIFDRSFLPQQDLNNCFYVFLLFQLDGF